MTKVGQIRTGTVKYGINLNCSYLNGLENRAGCLSGTLMIFFGLSRSIEIPSWKIFSVTLKSVLA